MYKNSKHLTHDSKTALVLSGGFAKAAFWHAGVVIGLEELGYLIQNNNNNQYENNITTIVGSSAGALVGSMLANGYGALDLIEAHLPPYNGKIPPLKYRDIFNLGIESQINPFSLLSINNKFEIIKFLNNLKSRPGFFSTDGIRNYLNKNILKNNDYKNYEIDFFVTATQLDHSRKCVFGKYKYPNPKHDSTTHYYINFPVDQTISASMSVPILYHPVKIKNPNTNEFNYFLDGEIRDTLSTHVAIDNGCEKIISSWIYTPYHYQKEIGSLFHYGMPAIGIQSLNLLIQKKIVSSRASFATARDILQTVDQYCVDQKLPLDKKRKLLNILEVKLNYKEKIQFIDIYPKVSDTDFFLTSSFSLSPKNIEKIVQLAKKRTIEVMNREL